MKALLVIPSAVQGMAMMVDEFYYHHKRGLGRWERLGHPVDSFFLLMPVALSVFTTPNESLKILFIVLSVISSLIITKDEWVHARECDAGEQWLHSVLFVLHPVVLLCVYEAWGVYPEFLTGFAATVFGFLVYQVTYWNFIK